MTFSFLPENYNINDFDLITHATTLYAIFVKKTPYPEYYNDAKEPNRYGLIETTDGINWQDKGDIITPEKGYWDESLWAGCISKQNNQYVIYYTGVKLNERQSSCKIGKAYSYDLKSWQKDKNNPVLEFDDSNPYYSDEPKLSFRDPFFFEYENKKYLIFCATDKSKMHNKRGCIGIVEEASENNFKWMPPVYSPELYSDGLECPALYKIKSKWYLIYGLDTENGGRQFRYAISNSPFGPFNELPNNILVSGDDYVCRIVDFNNKKLLYHWTRKCPEGVIREGLSYPKVVDINKDDSVSLSDYKTNG